MRRRAWNGDTARSLESPRELAGRIEREGPEVFERAVRDASPRLFRVAARLLCRREEARDAVQEALLRAFDALRAGRYDERLRMEAWLVTIVTRVSLDMLRSRKVRAPLVSDVDPAEIAWPEATSEQLSALVDLEHFLSNLPPDQRVAIILRFFEGMTCAEIAQALGTSEGAIEQRLVRARATLRRRMDENGT